MSKPNSTSQARTYSAENLAAELGVTPAEVNAAAAKAGILDDPKCCWCATEYEIYTDRANMLYEGVRVCIPVSNNPQYLYYWVGRVEVRKSPTGPATVTWVSPKPATWTRINLDELSTGLGTFEVLAYYHLGREGWQYMVVPTVVDGTLEEHSMCEVA